MRRSTRFVSLAALFLIACGSSDVGPGTMELGFYRNGTYVPLVAGGTCYVADAPQGGYWVMPAVRTTAIESEAMVECELVDDSLGMLGQIETFRVFDQADSHHEIEQFLLPLLEVDQPTFTELTGHTGTLGCMAIDDNGAEAMAEVDVVIATEVVR